MANAIDFKGNAEKLQNAFTAPLEQSKGGAVVAEIPTEIVDILKKASPHYEYYDWTKEQHIVLVASSETIDPAQPISKSDLSSKVDLVASKVLPLKREVNRKDNLLLAAVIATALSAILLGVLANPLCFLILLLVIPELALLAPETSSAQFFFELDKLKEMANKPSEQWNAFTAQNSEIDNLSLEEWLSVAPLHERWEGVQLVVRDTSKTSAFYLRFLGERLNWVKADTQALMQTIQERREAAALNPPPLPQDAHDSYKPSYVIGS